MQDTRQASETGAFFKEPATGVGCLVCEKATKQVAVIEPALDGERQSVAADTGLADRMPKAVAVQGAVIRWIPETRAHAGHLTAAPCIKAKTGAPIGIGERITKVRRGVRRVFDAR